MTMLRTVWRGHSCPPFGCVRVLVRGMFMRMSMLMMVRCLLPTLLPRQILLSTDPHIHLGRRNSAAHHRQNFEPRPQVQRRDSPLQQRLGHSRIHQRSQKHVAADPGKALKIRNAHTEIVVRRRFLVVGQPT